MENILSTICSRVISSSWPDAYSWRRSKCLEEEELEQIRKLLDPYAERIREFWLNVGEEK